MSFKIPKELESMGFERVVDIDHIKEGDLIFFPSASDAPKLRVTIPTLRKWGLSVTSDERVYRYNCNKYSAARRIFATCETYTWNNPTPTDEGSHALIVHNVRRNTNGAYANNGVETFTFSNANSIDQSSMKVEPPVYPIMAVETHLFDPMYPMTKHRKPYYSSCEQYPHSLSNSEDTDAMNMLLNHIKNSSLPICKSINSGYGHAGSYTDLPYFMLAASRLMYEKMYSEVIEKDAYVPAIGGSGYRGNLCMPQEASELIMTAPGRIDEKSMKDYCSYYLPNEKYEAQDTGLTMNKKFLTNIVKNGAIILRSKGMRSEASKMFADAVAKNMKERYDKLIHLTETFIAGIISELPKVKEIRDKFASAATELSTDETVLKAIKKTFGGF